MVDQRLPIKFEDIRRGDVVECVKHEPNWDNVFRFTVTNRTSTNLYAGTAAFDDHNYEWVLLERKGFTLNENPILGWGAYGEADTKYLMLINDERWNDIEGDEGSPEELDMAEFVPARAVPASALDDLRAIFDGVGTGASKIDAVKNFFQTIDDATEVW